MTFTAQGALLALAGHGPAWWPSAASTSADKVDTLFSVVTWISAFFFTLVVGLTVYFTVKYRRRHEGQKTSAVRGSFPIEVAWSVVPALILMFLFLWGFHDFMDLSVPPRNALDIRVTGQQWFWTFEYPKDGISTNELAVPVGRPVRLTMSSSDVIHSFYVPAFRVKRDVLPNRYTVLWFEPTEVGTFDIFCAEYCGTNHSTMITRIKVMTDQEYKAWVESGGGLSGKGLSSEEFGKLLFQSKGCTSCHSVDGSVKTGPSLLGKYGLVEHFKDGSSTSIDDNYIRQSIMEPNAKVVSGFDPVMPSYAGKLSDKQVDALIDYIKSLRK